MGPGMGPPLGPGMGPGMHPGTGPGMGPGIGPGMHPAMQPAMGPGMGPVPGMPVAVGSSAGGAGDMAPANPSDPRAGSECVVPMWNSKEFLCEEHADLKDEATYEDAKGIRRKRMHDGADCTCQCPEARWWQVPSQETLVCKDGRWRDDTGHPAKDLVCDTSNRFYFSSLGVGILAAFLATPGGRKSFRQAAARPLAAAGFTGKDSKEGAAAAKDPKEGQAEASKAPDDKGPPEGEAEAPAKPEAETEAAEAQVKP